MHPQHMQEIEIDTDPERCRKKKASLIIRSQLSENHHDEPGYLIRDVFRMLNLRVKPTDCAQVSDSRTFIDKLSDIGVDAAFFAVIGPAYLTGIFDREDRPSL